MVAARADAFGDLLLENVDATTTVMLMAPVEGYTPVDATVQRLPYGLCDGCGPSGTVFGGDQPDSGSACRLGESFVSPTPIRAGCPTPGSEDEGHPGGPPPGRMRRVRKQKLRIQSAFHRSTRLGTVS